MSDQPEDQSGAAEPATAPAAAWPEAGESPAWAEIADQAESAAPGPAGPGASPEQPTEVQPATEAGRARRPSSLRDSVTPPVSEVREQGNPRQVPNTATKPGPASLLGRFPKDKLPTDKIPMDRIPLDKLPTDKLAVDRLRALTKQRPEVGLGLAFAGGLVIATILKRLGRR